MSRAAMDGGFFYKGFMGPKLSENMSVNITLGFLGILLSGVVGFAIWMATMQFGLEANASDLRDAKAQITELRDTLNRIDKNVVELNTLLRNRKGEK